MSKPIEVTACRVFLNPEDDEHLMGFASIVLNDAFAVCDLKIINGHKGLFVAMPSRRRNNGTFHDVAHPINQGLRNLIEEVVLAEYHVQVTRSRESLATPSAAVLE